MAWSRLAVVGELAPGVVSLAVKDGTLAPLLTIKPGSYVWPENLTHLKAWAAS